MRILILALLLLVSPVSAGAFEDIPLGVDRIDVSAKRGSHNTVVAAAQDSDGYIWLASLPGLYVYDGNLVRPVLEDLLKGTRIRDMHMDSGDTLWLATNAGVLSYSLKSHAARWHRDTNSTEGLASDTVHSLFEDSRGTLWLGTASRKHEDREQIAPDGTGLHRYEASFGRFERVRGLGLEPDDAAVIDIREDRQRNLWLATDKGLYRLDGNQGPAAYIPLSSGESYSAKRMAFDGSGNLWVSVSQRGLWKLHTGQDGPELRKVSDVPVSHVQDLQADAQGDVLVCSDKGLFRYAAREGQFYRHPFVFSEQPLQTPEVVMSVLETSAGNLWIGTINQGVLRHAAHPGARIAKLALQPSATGDFPVLLADINHVAVSPDSRIYVAPKGGGVFRSAAPVTSNRLSHSSRIDLEPFLEGIRIKSMNWDRNGFLVCGLENALLRVAPNGSAEWIQVKPDTDADFSDRDVEDIVCMDSGEIWFATKFELFSWKPGDSAPKMEMKKSDRGRINCLHRQNDAVWVGQGQDVTVIDTGSGQRSAFDLPPEAWADNATVKNILVENGGTVWIATTKGVLHFGPQSRALRPVLTKTRQRIPHALSLWRHADGSIWVHTQEKIFRIPPDSELAEEILLGAPHPSVSISSGPMVLPGGVLAYGHTDGLLLIDPQSIVKPAQNIPKISEVRIFGTPLPPTRLGRMPEHLAVDHRQNYLTFTFTLPEASSFHPPRFFYFLEGVDAAWNDAGPQKTVSYANLEPGSYSLHVKEGFGGEHVSSLSIEISAPWWMTPWAKTGYVLAFVLTVLVASRVFAHLQTTRIRKEMLENLVMQDPLTEVPNRRKFKEVLAAEKSRCKRSNHQISVLMIDIDFFKGFNDRFGHQAGDKALKSVARTLSAALRRPEDFVARFGGEEFVIVLPSTNRAGAERVAQKIQDAIFQANIPYPGSPLSDRITLSIGISTFSPQTDLHIDSGLFSADQALYQAKRNGRNCVFYKDHCLALTPLRQ